MAPPWALEKRCRRARTRALLSGKGTIGPVRGVNGTKGGGVGVGWGWGGGFVFLLGLFWFWGGRVGVFRAGLLEERETQTCHRFGNKIITSLRLVSEEN